MQNDASPTTNPDMVRLFLFVYRDGAQCSGSPSTLWFPGFAAIGGMQNHIGENVATYRPTPLLIDKDDVVQIVVGIGLLLIPGLSTIGGVENKTFLS
jgi:hypothetical protein